MEITNSSLFPYISKITSQNWEKILQWYTPPILTVLSWMMFIFSGRKHIITSYFSMNKAITTVSTTKNQTKLNVTGTYLPELRAVNQQPKNTEKNKTLTQTPPEYNNNKTLLAASRRRVASVRQWRKVWSIITVLHLSTCSYTHSSISSLHCRGVEENTDFAITISTSSSTCHFFLMVLPTCSARSI